MSSVRPRRGWCRAAASSAPRRSDPCRNAETPLRSRESELSRNQFLAVAKGIHLHAVRAGRARFDDSSLASSGGLVQVLASARRAGLHIFGRSAVEGADGKGAHAGSKVAALVTGVVAVADSIEDMAVIG